MPRPWSEATWRREVRAEIVRYFRAQGWKLPRQRRSKARAVCPCCLDTEPMKSGLDSRPFRPDVGEPLPCSYCGGTGRNPDAPQSHQDAPQPFPRAVPDGVACPDCSQVFPDRPAYLAHDINAHLPAKVAALRPERTAKKGWTV